MAERTLFLVVAYFKVLLILLNSIPHVYSKDCSIKRDERDRILVPINRSYCTPSNNPCSVFGGILDLNEAAECTCVCQRNNPTYMESTDKCSSFSDVQSECSFTFKGQSLIPVIPIVLELNIPKKFRKCRKMEANRKKSFYLSGSIWKQLPETDKFPFTVDIRIVRGRVHSAYVKMARYIPPKLNGKLFRLGISCGRRNDCVTFKIPGKTLDQCIVHPTSANLPSSSTLVPLYIPSNNTTPSATPTRKHTIVSEPSGTNKTSRASSRVEIPWSVIGTIITLLIVLILCIIILAVCFWRRKTKSSGKKQAGNATSQSSEVTLSFAERQPEVTYASPHHPYQELKPLPSGTPHGVYQPLNWTAREDASGYMLPSESTATNQPDPLYNEIGSPRRPLPPVYDYALPENTVRSSNHLSNIDLSRINGVPNASDRNEPNYVGRPLKDQQEPKSPPLESAAPATVNDEPSCISPLYLDFSSEGVNQPESSECKNPDSGREVAPALSNRYKKPRNGPTSTFEKSSPNEHPYSVLESLTSPVDQPIRLSKENLQDINNKESMA